jgi:hypothetical protein
VTIRTAAALVTLIVAPACQRGARAPEAASPQAERAPAAEFAQGRGPRGAQDEAAAAGARVPVPAATPRPGAANGPSPVLASRKLIRTGQVGLEVPSFPRAAEAVRKLAEELGGYVAESRAARQAGDRQGGSLTLRVPAERFEAAMGALKALGKVTGESTSTQDVTKAYTDLETRLRIKREAAGRVHEILKARTARLSDVLEAERELARLTEEIEGMEGERRYYDQQIALSTITVEVQEPAPVLASSRFAPIAEAVRESVEVLAASVAAIIYATVFLLPWIVLGAAAWRVVRRVRARRRRTS